MARLAVAGCAAIGLYFLLVCLVTGHSSVLISSASQQSSEISATSRAPSSSSLRFQAEVDADDQQSAVVVDDIRVLPDPPSRKQRKQHLRAKSASKVRGNPTDRHRYTLSDGGPSDDADDNKENKDDDPKRSSPSSYSDCSYHLAFTLVEANGSSGQGKRSKLLGKFRNCLSSVLRHLNSTGYESGALCIHLITSGGDALRSAINDVIVRVHEHLVEMRSNHDHDHGHRKHQASFEDAKDFDGDQDQDEDHHHLRRPLTKYFFIDSAAVEARLEGGPSPRAPLLATLRRHFTNQRSGPNAYYSNALFFYSMVLHQVLPSAVADRLLLLDVDVQLEANLLELYEEFGRFTAEQVMGIAYEQQPVYRHILHEYRRLNENTTAGSPPPLSSSSSPSSSPSSPGGFPGYNSGVLLLHLRKMRSSFLYNSLLNEALIGHLARKYHFRGHLGDQDFYTLAALDYPQLFYTLDCAWNRQLCQWWRFHGYGAVFDAYHRCSSSTTTGVKLYHGNCNSAMPSMAVPTSDGNFEQLRR